MSAKVEPWPLLVCSAHGAPAAPLSPNMERRPGAMTRLAEQLRALPKFPLQACEKATTLCTSLQFMEPSAHIT